LNCEWSYSSFKLAFMCDA